MVAVKEGGIKLPPHDEVAERALTGAVLLDGTIFPDVLKIVTHEDMFLDPHRRIMLAAHHIHALGFTPDIVAVRHHLDANRELVDVGTDAYLKELLDAYPSTAAWQYHAKIIKECSGRRRLRHLMQEVERDVEDAPPSATMARLDSGLAAIRSRFSTESASKWPAAKPVSELSADGTAIPWVWNGYLARGHLTLFSALAKCGKTTLLSHLLRSLQYGMKFLGRDVIESKTLIVSEESETLWAMRRDALFLDEHLVVISKPFVGKPTLAEFEEFIRFVGKEAERLGCTNVVIDTLSKFAPWKSENDNAEVQAVMNALDALTRQGLAVLLMHHTGKTDMGEGRSSRGGSAITGAADIVLELRRFKGDETGDRRRVITGLGRFDEIPEEVVISLSDDASDYTAEGDRRGVKAREYADSIRLVMPTAEPGATADEIWSEMPTGNRPKRGDVMKLLQSGADAGHWKKGGAGKPPKNPYRFWAA